MLHWTYGFKRMITPAAFLVTFALPLSASASAEPDERARLGHLLESLPNLTTFFSSDPDTTPLGLYYANLRAAERAGDASSPDSLEAFRELEDAEFSRWSTAISRLYGFNLLQEVSSEALAHAGVSGTRNVFHRFPELLGVDWFSIDQLAEFGIPPYSVVVALGDVSTEATETVASALESSGFERREAHGVTEWHRFADLETHDDVAVAPDIMGRRTVDPFGIAAGHAARILISDGRLSGSGVSDLSTMVAATWNGDFPNLRASPEFRAGLFAVADPERYSGQLVQAFLTTRRFPADHVAIRHLGPYTTPEQREAYLDRLKAHTPPAVPDYELVVLADRQEGTTETTVLGLVYQNEPAADHAARALPGLFDGFEPVNYGARLVATENLRPTSHVYADSPKGPYVALIEFHRPLEADAEFTSKPEKIYRVLWEAMVNVDFSPLIDFE